MPRDSIDRNVRLAALRAEIAALGIPFCGMAHERIGLGPDGLPQRDAMSESGFSRPGLCPAGLRGAHLGCSHTTARIRLMRALDALGGGADDGLGEVLQGLDAALGTIDHRRYAVETRRADALHAGDADAAVSAEASVRAIVTEHRGLGLRVGEVRDAILVRLDAALAG